MIVKCEQCQTRFRIPDDKVTDKGVKVRCTKCQHTFRVTRADDASAAAGPAAAPPGGPLPVPTASPARKQPTYPTQPPPAAPPEADPFARFGAAEPGMGVPTRPGLFALGVEATRVPERQPQSRVTGFDFASLVPPAPAAPPASAAPAPFDFSAIAPPSAPAAGGGSAQPFDFSAMTAPPPPPMAAPPPQPQRAAAPPAAATPSFDFSGLAPLAPTVEIPAQAQAPIKQPEADLDVDLDVQGPPAPRHTDEFFGTPLAPAERKPLLDLPDDMPEEEARKALFELPPSPPPQPEIRAEPQRPAAPPPAMPAAPVVKSQAPARRRSVLGLIVNIVIAAVLMGALVVVGSAWLNDGKVTAESLSFKQLKATFVPDSEFVASDISNGLYDTQSGRAVFFVRGDVMNRSRMATKVSITAEIVEDARVVRSARGLVGAVPTPEELFTLGVGEDLEKTLDARLAPRAVVLEPGASAPFLIVFTEYPPDLKEFRVRVVPRADGSPTALNP